MILESENGRQMFERMLTKIAFPGEFRRVHNFQHTADLYEHLSTSFRLNELSIYNIEYVLGSVVYGLHACASQLLEARSCKLYDIKYPTFQSIKTCVEHTSEIIFSYCILGYEGKIRDEYPGRLSTSLYPYVFPTVQAASR